MYAIVETGGKQYQASVGDVLEVERLDVEPGQTVEFDRVLLVRDDGGTQVGTPVVDGAIVKGEALGEAKANKVIVFKMKRRKGYRRKAGHRQLHARVKITAIELKTQANSAKPAKPAAKATDDAGEKSPAATEG